jgi:hypothetical protein
MSLIRRNLAGTERTRRNGTLPKGTSAVPANPMIPRAEQPGRKWQPCHLAPESRAIETLDTPVYSCGIGLCSTVTRVFTRPVPDLAERLHAADQSIKRALFDAFDLRVDFDKASDRLSIGATFTEAVVPCSTPA